ncbi:MAG: TetR/AcrR family transcriptional regulator [Actinomycetota bacterium]|jgi:TetR/AcrR family transcriptional regulator, cholesterol catabolism regulator
MAEKHSETAHVGVQDPSAASTAGTPPRRRTRGRPREAVPYEERWKAIIDAAATIFHRKGYEATSIHDIAEAVGMLKGSLYYYIETKEDLLFAVIHEVHEELLRNYEVYQRAEGDAPTRIRAFIEGHVATNARLTARAAVFYRDFYSLNPERRAVIIDQRDKYDRHLREMIQQGQREGTLCGDIDPKITAIAMLGMMNTIYQWYHLDGDRTPEEVARSYADLLLGGLTCTRHVPGHRARLGRLPKPALPKRRRPGRVT